MIEAMPPEDATLVSWLLELPSKKLRGACRARGAVMDVEKRFLAIQLAKSQNLPTPGWGVPRVDVDFRLRPRLDLRREATAGEEATAGLRTKASPSGLRMPSVELPFGARDLLCVGR